MITKDEVREIAREYVGKKLLANLTDEVTIIEALGPVLGTRADIQSWTRDAFVEIIRELVPASSIGRRY